MNTATEFVLSLPTLIGMITLVSVFCIGLASLYWQKKLVTMIADKARAEAEMDAFSVQIDQLMQEKTTDQEKQQQLQQRFIELSRQYAALKATLEQKQQHFQEQLAMVRDQKELLKTEFSELANDIFEQKSRNFKALNQESIETLLKPVQHEMQGFRQKVESIHTEELKQRSELKAELLHLQKLNQEITQQAERLTTALQGQKKLQGNWGELMLENVLDNAGLRAGVDYQREVSFQGEYGRQRPDVVVYLPQHKHLIIDAKTSLAAYTRYVNSETESERVFALREHVRAIDDRIQELSDRNYFKLNELNSPEVVIMFIPIESAYVEALKYDGTLYQRALERNVLVATPTTLLTSLNIVRQLWRFEDQNKHTAELANRAERFYTKLNAFLTSMSDVGKQLDKARETYDKAFSQLYSGKANLIKQAAEFKDLGVSVQKELPEALVAQAKLELEQAPPEHQFIRNE